MSDIFDLIHRDPLKEMTQRMYESAGLLPTFEDRIYQMTGVDLTGKRSLLMDIYRKYGLRPIEFKDPNLNKEK
jgi:hypothetical protein